MDGDPVSRGREGKDQYVCPIDYPARCGANAEYALSIADGGWIGIGEAIVSAAQGADGVASFGQPLAKMGHAQISPDDGEAERRGRRLDGLVHGRSLLSGRKGRLGRVFRRVTGYAITPKRVKDELRGGNVTNDGKIRGEMGIILREAAYVNKKFIQFSSKCDIMRALYV